MARRQQRRRPHGIGSRSAPPSRHRVESLPGALSADARVVDHCFDLFGDGGLGRIGQHVPATASNRLPGQTCRELLVRCRWRDRITRSRRQSADMDSSLLPACLHHSPQVRSHRLVFWDHGVSSDASRPANRPTVVNLDCCDRGWRDRHSLRRPLRSRRGARGRPGGPIPLTDPDREQRKAWAQAAIGIVGEPLCGVIHQRERVVFIFPRTSSATVLAPRRRR